MQNVNIGRNNVGQGDVINQKHHIPGRQEYQGKIEAEYHKRIRIHAENEQQKQIGDQQKLINELTRRLDSQQPSYGMVAEEIHRETE